MRTGLAGLACASGFAQGSRQDVIPVIDTHVHLFDPTRPGGITWPEANDPIYKPTLPDRLRQLAMPFGVVGAIAIEASPLPSDNDWLLSVVERNPFMLGMIGNLDPGTSGFAKELARFRSSDLFKGIRYGNLWGRDLAAVVGNRLFLDDLARLSDASLVFESANPDLRLLAALQTISDRLPRLTIVIDHLPHMEVAADATSQRNFESRLNALGANPRVFAKLSELILPANSSAEESQQMNDRLELLWRVFGPNRLMFGSDWPNGDHVADYGATIGAARAFVATKGHAAERKVFWENSRAVYKWQARLDSQRG